MITGFKTRSACERTRCCIIALRPFPANAVVRGYHSFDCIIPHAERSAAPESSV